MNVSLIVNPDPVVMHSRTQLRPAKIGLCAILAALVWAVLSIMEAGAAESTNAPASDPEAFKSVFVNDPSFGRDPFFPNSSRWPVIKPVAVSATMAAPPPPDFPTEIILKGISGSANRRLALLNHYTITAGEEVDLKINSQVYKVKCLEIKERSVVLTYKGFTKELQLRRGL